MALYAITWQLNSLQSEITKAEQEARIIERIKELPHYHEEDQRNLWFVSVSWGVERLHRFIYSRFEAPDRYWIFELGMKSGSPMYAGKSGKSFGEWVERMEFEKERYNLDRIKRLKGEL